MAGNATIGALNVVLGLDSAEFTDGLSKAQVQLKKVGAQMQSVGQSLTGIGGALSLALTAPVLAFGAASMQAARESKEAFGQVESALKSMGAASGRTAEQLQDAAAQLQAMSTFDDDDILRNVTANLLTFGNVSGEVFDRAQQAAVDLSARLGQDLQSSAIQLGKALNDPIKGITALARVGVSFTEQQQAQIKAMVEAGNVAGAQKAILAELERQYGGAAEALRASTPNAAMIDQWRAFQETVGEIAENVIPPLLDAATAVLGAFNELSPEAQRTAIAIAAIAAAAGPVTIAVGSVASTVGGFVIALGGASAAATTFGGAMSLALGPLGLAVTAVAAVAAGLLILQQRQTGAAQAQATANEVTESLTKSTSAYEAAALAAASASGEARVSALKEAAALRETAIQAQVAAKEKIKLAQATLAAIQAQNQQAIANDRFNFRGDAAGTIRPTLNAGKVAAQQKLIEGANKALEESIKKIASADRILNAPIPKLGAIGDAGEKGFGRVAKGASAAKSETEEFDKKLQDVLDRLMTDNERATQQAADDIDVLREAFDRGKLSAAEFHEQLLRMRKETASTAPLMGANDKLTRPWEEASDALQQATDEQERLWDQSLERMGFSFRGFFQGWIANGKADWKRLLLDLTSDWQNTMNVLARLTGGLGATLKGALSGLGGAVAGLGIGQSLGLGTGSKTADLGLSIGGSIAGGLLASSSFAGTIGAGIANGLVGMGASTAIAGGLGAMLTSAAVLGPVAAIAALALGSVFKGKPTNAGAGYDLVSGQLSGDKRTAETEKAVTAAADAIRQGQEMLTAAGVTLGTTVNGLVIGTRDLSQIYLSNGKTLTSAVGDSAAAVEAALKGVLDGATFASEAQESLVRSMLAAGKGFDDIAAALTAFGDAQKLPQTIADAIQQLQDPAAFDLEQLKREQEARRKSVQAQVDAGYLTAAQFASLTEQLRILEGLEVDKAMGRLVSQIDAATASSDAVASARDALRTAYERESGELETVISRLKTLGASLRSFGQSLITGPLAMLSPKARYDATRAEFERVRQAALRGDEDALARLPDVAQAFLEASQEFNAATPAYFADLSAVKSAVSATASLADGLANEAEAQLEALNKQVAGQIELNKNVISVKDAVIDLGKALAFFSTSRGQNLGANPSVNAALASATGYAGDFGAGGWQAWIVQQSEQIKAVARQILTAFGQPERISGFATGGSFKVGGSGGIDSQLVQFRASPDETVSITKPGQMSDSLTEVAVLRRIEARVGAVEDGIRSIFTQAGAAANRAYDQGERQVGQLKALSRTTRTSNAR